MSASSSDLPLLWPKSKLWWAQQAHRLNVRSSEESDKVIVSETSVDSILSTLDTLSAYLASSTAKSLDRLSILTPINNYIYLIYHEYVTNR